VVVTPDPDVTTAIAACACRPAWHGWHATDTPQLPVTIGIARAKRLSFSASSRSPAALAG
jgi:hypothetical protein